MSCFSNKMAFPLQKSDPGWHSGPFQNEKVPEGIAFRDLECPIEGRRGYREQLVRLSTTRRFNARPSSVELSAIG
jgi:hypothetical protein